MSLRVAGEEKKIAELVRPAGGESAIRQRAPKCPDTNIIADNRLSMPAASRNCQPPVKERNTTPTSKRCHEIASKLGLWR